MKKKIIAFALAFICSITATASTACRRTPAGDEPIDTTRTQLYVGNYGGGYGDRWLKALKVRFEEAYKDVSFESGKVGVQIMDDSDKNAFHAPQLMNTIQASNYEVFFTEGANYHGFVERNNLLEITDIMDEKIDGEDKSILDKLSVEQEAYLNTNNKYYAIPHYQAYRGIIYDYDLFNTGGGLFISKDGGYCKDNGNLSNGPDGVAGTYDDGLPATYDEFFALCEYMKSQRSMIPISWTGEYKETYTNYLLDALYVDYEGKDSYNLLKNGGTTANNTTKLVTGFDANNSPILSAPVTINMDNITQLKKQAGRYHALDFLSRVISGNYYSQGSVTSTQKHVMAQADFLYSRYDRNPKPIGMLVDGIWWIEEADPVFIEMEPILPGETGRKDRRFGFMPMPKPSEEYLGAPTLFDGNEALCFINGNITNPDKIALAKEFVKFATNDESLREFTLLTGAPKDFLYELDDDYDDLEFFSKTVFDMKKASDGVCYSQFVSSQIANQINEKDDYLHSFRSTVAGQSKLYPVNTFLFDSIGGSPITARQYFEGMA